MAARSLPTTAPQRLRLLFVEDDVDSLSLVQRVVAGRKDLALLQAADMDAAFKLASRRQPDVMLIDLDLVAVGAVALMKILRANAGTRLCPVVALADDALPEAAVKALHAGFFHYLVKPLVTGPLTEALDYALEFAALERAEL